MQRLLGIVALAVVCTAGFGARQYGMSGCGLGSYVVDPDAGGFAHVFGYTTHGTVPGGAFFPIISGTSNCVPDSARKTAQSQEQFILNNFASLSKEISQGQGETLSAFTEVLGCDGAGAGIVRDELKNGAAEILAAPGAIAALEAVKQILNRNPDAGKSCRYLG